MSLSARLALLIFAALLLLIGVLGIAGWIVARHELTRSFDTALLANAEAIATLVEVNDEGRLELEFADEIMRRFSRSATPDVFMVFDSTGALVEKSQQIENLPVEASNRAGGVAFDFNWKKHSYRGLVLHAQARDESDDSSPTEVHVFYGTSRKGLDEAARRIAVLWAVVLVLGAIAVAPVSLLVSRSGLKPLGEFTQTLDGLSPRNLDVRLDERSFPRDLRGLAAAFNGLLHRLSEAFAREKQFTADAAHELRTPVAALKTAIQAARCEKTGVKTQGEENLLADLEADVERLETLCEQLLLVTSTVSVQAQSMTMDDLADEIGQVIGDLRPTAEARGTRLDFEIHQMAGQSASVLGSRLLTRRIASNLIQNAIVHGGSQIRVVIRIEKGSDSVAVAIEDNGPGIAPEARERLFERFFRADPSRSREQGGAGLGLSICRELARSQGGDVTFDPLEPGARFTWTLAIGTTLGDKDNPMENPAPELFCSRHITEKGRGR